MGKNNVGMSSLWVLKMVMGWICRSRYELLMTFEGGCGLDFPFWVWVANDFLRWMWVVNGY